MMKHTILLFFTGVILFTSCSKAKQDIIAGHQISYDNLAPSTVRIMLGTGYDMIVNGDSLTNFLVPALSGPPNIPNPTPYFPTTGKLTEGYFLPQQFLDASGKATVKIMMPQTPPNPFFLLDSFQVQEDYYHPIDYYLAGTQILLNGATGVTAIPRAVTPASDPTHIRIRLINLGVTSSGIFPGVPVSLAYSNGTLVSTSTSGIANGKWSDYVELPYGTYAFRVLIDGKQTQIPGKAPQLMNVASQQDLTIAGGQYYIPTRTFQPGGVYSLVVAYVNGSYQYREYPIQTNGFFFETDIKPAVNITYARVQGINAAEKNGLHFKIDGADSAIAYGTASGYSSLITGQHNVAVTDAAGKLLVQQAISVKGGDNISLWVYPTTSGKDSIAIVQNNMGGLRNTGSNADGSDISTSIYDPLNFDMVTQTRFLNLCPDINYATFTQANGALFSEGRFSSASASCNLPFGATADPIAVPYPYVDLRYGSYDNIEAYQSAPGVLPGNRLIGTPDLVPANFVRMPNYFYPNQIAGKEPGVYTVALIGRNNGTEQPKMIVVKHNL